MNWAKVAAPLLAMLLMAAPAPAQVSLSSGDFVAAVRDRDGETPLIAAARIGYMGALGDLLRLKAKVDAANRMGETALIVAVQNRHPDIVKVLLALGADPDKSDSAAGYSARDYAKRDTRSRDILKLIEAADAERKAASKPKIG